MVARCSKCDFWNLGIIWHRNMWTKKNWSKIFRRKKSENFWSKKIGRKIRSKKSNFVGRKKSDQKNLEKKSVFFDRKFFDHKNSIFFRSDFSTNCFFDQKFSDFFRRKIGRPKNFRAPISILNFPKIPKITLRKSCGEF